MGDTRRALPSPGSCLHCRERLFELGGPRGHCGLLGRRGAAQWAAGAGCAAPAAALQNLCAPENILRVRGAIARAAFLALGLLIGLGWPPAAPLLRHWRQGWLRPCSFSHCWRSSCGSGRRAVVKKCRLAPCCGQGRASAALAQAPLRIVLRDSHEAGASRAATRTGGGLPRSRLTSRTGPPRLPYFLNTDGVWKRRLRGRCWHYLPTWGKWRPNLALPGNLLAQNVYLSIL